MNQDEAAAALEEVAQTRRKLADRAHWPFHRHAMFGLAEALLVAGVAQPVALMAGMFAAAMALVVVCVLQDRQRHGMFVSGWQEGPTRPLTIMLTLFVFAMLVAAFVVRGGESVQPLGYAAGAITFVVCTIASLRWEKIYQAQLRAGGSR